MKNKFLKLISLFLCFCFICTTFSKAALEVSVLKDNDANYLKFVTGFNDGTFRPDAALTRAQAAKMISFIVDAPLNNEVNKEFTDITEDHWAFDAISTLASLGVLNGYSDDKFYPDKNMTRAEFAAVISRICEAGEGSGATFKDISNHWAKDIIISLSSKNIIGGYPDGTFKPDAFLTRAEAVVIINRVTETQINKNEDRKLFSDLNSTHWAYYDIMSAASTTNLETTVFHDKIHFNDIEYIELNSKELTKTIDSILAEFPNAAVERQGEIFNQISKLESDVALAISMSTINAERNVTSEKDKINVANSYECANAIREAKRSRYDLTSEVKDIEIFESVIGMKIEDIPLPALVLPEKLIELYTEETQYKEDFSEFMYSNSISYYGQEYSLSQAETSGDPVLVQLALDYYVTHEGEYGQIFSNLVDVRTRIAHYFGYRYYTDIGYMISGKAYYVPEDLDGLRYDIKTYIAPLFYKLTLAKNGYDIGYYNFSEGDLTPKNIDYLSQIKDYLHDLSPQTREAYNYIEQYGMSDTEIRENKAYVSFSTYIDSYEAPYLFINETKTAYDVENYAHEFGHVLQAFRIGEKGVTSSSDICEIASYGMEMLIQHNYESFFGDNAKNVILNGFYDKLSMILLTTFMDEFQYRVYSDPFLTIQERNQLYASLYKEYFIGAYYTHEATKRGIRWTNPMHVFTAPYYAIDYTLALAVAFQLWEIGETEGFDKQFETYMKILETPYIDNSISWVARGAGLKSPLYGEIYKEIAEKIDSMFKLNS